MSYTADVLPLGPLPEGAPRRTVRLALGEHGARLPRNVAEGIRDIRFPGEAGLEGLRVDTGQWVDLLPFNAERLPDVIMEPLD